ncbi:ras-related protein RABC1-like [Trifolium pratense]|uniref:Ras-related protein RABC1-like n=1 Tax=Trifolium pratense TaxID=57577 RepID=A0A2K3P9N1_TRIPR|nr:ras-related protein RABC1-like [Trifolium pratense]
MATCNDTAATFISPSAKDLAAYDVTRRDTFTNLSEVWAKEVELYSTNPDCIKMLVGNKVDKESDRAVTKKEGTDFAREYGCLFIECSAKTRVNVQHCFEELVLKILDTPSLLAEGSKGNKKNIFKDKALQSDSSATAAEVLKNKESRFLIRLEYL